MAKVTRWRLVVGCVFLFLSFAAHFHRCSEFGLYEDDYFHIATVIARGPSYLLTMLATLPGLPQGRPLQYFLNPLFAWVGTTTAGLVGCYWLALMIVALNAWLLYTLVRRRRSELVALTAGLAWCLSPTDTTKILLTHAFGIQPAVTLLLVAFHLYDRGRLRWSFVPAVGALLTYETLFPVFAAAPLLSPRAGHSRLARHVGLVAAILTLDGLLRLVVGETRAIDATGNAVTFLPRLAAGLALGPAASCLLHVWGPYRTLSWWDGGTVLWAGGSALAVGHLLHRAQRCTVFAGSDGRPTGPRNRDWNWDPELLIAGVAMVVLGYALSFTHYPPIAPAGRGTSVHIAAGLGCSLLVAWTCERLVRRARHPRTRSMLIGAVAAYLGVLVGYHNTIQSDFARSWGLQRQFWTEAVDLCPDLRPGTVIINELPDKEPTRFIRVNSWADPLILGLVWDFPPSWSPPPRLFTLSARWPERLQRSPAGTEWEVPAATWPPHLEPLSHDSLIVLRREAGRLMRLPAPSDTARDADTAPRRYLEGAGLRPGPLHDLLVGPTP